MQEILIRAGCFVTIIILGHLLRRTGIFGPETFGVLSKVVMKITLPAAVVVSCAGRDIAGSMLMLILIGFGSGVVCMTVGWLAYRNQSRQHQAFAMMHLSGYNIGTFALPFAQSFLGPVGVLTTSIFDVGNAFICLGGSYGVARAVQEGGRLDVRRVLKAPFTSVPFVTYLVMTSLNLLSLTPPAPVLSFAQILGNANAFLAMLMIGVGFRLPAGGAHTGALVRLLVLRFGLSAILALCWYFLLPFDPEIRKTLVILTFAPIGSATPAYTGELKGDVGLASAANSLSILISIVIIVTLLTVML